MKRGGVTVKCVNPVVLYTVTNTDRVKANTTLNVYSIKVYYSHSVS